MDLSLAVSNSKVAEILDDITIVHKWVRNNIEFGYVSYKERDGQSKRFQSFKQGNFMMVHLIKGRFTQGTYSKLKNKFFGP